MQDQRPIYEQLHLEPTRLERRDGFALLAALVAVAFLAVATISAPGCTNQGGPPDALRAGLDNGTVG